MTQAERVDIEEKYSSLQEEANGKTKKLKKVWTMLMQAKSEVYLRNNNFIYLNSLDLKMFSVSLF